MCPVETPPDTQNSSVPYLLLELRLPSYCSRSIWSLAISLVSFLPVLPLAVLVTVEGTFAFSASFEIGTFGELIRA